MRTLSTTLALTLTCLITGLGAAETTGVTVTGTTWGGKQVLMVRAPGGEAIDPQQAAKLRLQVSVDWRETPVIDALEHVAKLTGANLVIDPALRAEGANDITFAADGMRADLVLKWLKTLARVEITPMHGALYVSRNPPKLAQRVTIYDVSDLVAPVRDFPGPELSIPEAGGDGGLFIPGFEPEEPERMDVEELAEIVQLHFGKD